MLKLIATPGPVPGLQSITERILERCIRFNAENSFIIGSVGEGLQFLRVVEFTVLYGIPDDAVSGVNPGKDLDFSEVDLFLGHGDDKVVMPGTRVKCPGCITYIGKVEIADGIC